MGVEIGDDGLVLKTTELAVRVQVEGETIWIPKSVLSDEGDIDEDSEEGDEGRVVVRSWWAKQEGYD